MRAGMGPDQGESYYAILGLVGAGCRVWDLVVEGLREMKLSVKGSVGWGDVWLLVRIFRDVVMRMESASLMW